MRRYLFLFVVASSVLVACEGNRNNTSWSDKKEGTEVVPSINKTPSTGAATTDSAAVDTSQAKH